MLSSTAESHGPCSALPRLGTNLAVGSVHVAQQSCLCPSLLPTPLFSPSRISTGSRRQTPTYLSACKSKGRSCPAQRGGRQRSALPPVLPSCHADMKPEADTPRVISQEGKCVCSLSVSGSNTVVAFIYLVSIILINIYHCQLLYKLYILTSL